MSHILLPISGLLEMVLDRDGVTKYYHFAAYVTACDLEKSLTFQLRNYKPYALSD